MKKLLTRQYLNVKTVTLFVSILVIAFLGLFTISKVNAKEPSKIQNDYEVLDTIKDGSEEIELIEYKYHKETSSVELVLRADKDDDTYKIDLSDFASYTTESEVKENKKYIFLNIMEKDYAIGKDNDAGFLVKIIDNTNSDVLGSFRIKEFEYTKYVSNEGYDIYVSSVAVVIPNLTEDTLVDMEICKNENKVHVISNGEKDNAYSIRSRNSLSGVCITLNKALNSNDVRYIEINNQKFYK